VEKACVFPRGVFSLAVISDVFRCKLPLQVNYKYDYGVHADCGIGMTMGYIWYIQEYLLLPSCIFILQFLDFARDLRLSRIFFIVRILLAFLIIYFVTDFLVAPVTCSEE
jgi:hypothetical protein